MNLTDMMIYADIKQLHQFAECYQCLCNLNSKHQLIQSILSEIVRKDVIRMRISELHHEAQRFLHHLMFDSSEVFTIEELMAMGQSVNGQKQLQPEHDVRLIICQIKQRGWLFHGHTPQTNSLYYIPKDLRKRIQEELRQQLHHEIVLCTKQKPVVDTHQGQALISDIYSFLEYIEEHKGLTLKTNYSLSKRDITQILNRFQDKEKSVVQQGCRVGYGRMFHEYPNRFSFMYDYCCDQQYISEDYPNLHVTAQGKKRLLMKLVDEPRQLYEYWLKLYRIPIPNLPLIVHWMDQLAPSWVTLSSLKLALLPLIKPYYYDSVETIFEERILQMLHYLGFIHFTEDSESGPLLQFSALGHRCLNELRIAK
jgi:hypothetical protein